MSIGINIQKLRINNGLTQEQFAEKLGVSRQSISKWEIGQSLPEIDKVVLMSKLFSFISARHLLSKKNSANLFPQFLVDTFIDKSFS